MWRIVRESESSRSGTGLKVSDGIFPENRLKWCKWEGWVSQSVWGMGFGSFFGKLVGLFVQGILTCPGHHIISIEGSFCFSARY